MADFVWIPIIPMTLILGIIQLIFVHKDESFRGSHAITHSIHILFVMPVFLFAIFNTEYFLELTGLINSGIPLISNIWAVRVAIGLVFGIKSYIISRVLKTGGGGTGMHEGFIHVLLMMVLVTFSPLLWGWFGPVITPYLPNFLQ